MVCVVDSVYKTNTPPHTKNIDNFTGVTHSNPPSRILVHLSEQLKDGQVDMFAPDVPQMHVIDHIKGEPAVGETRNVLTESARIARGNVSALSELRSKEYDAVLFPGGFGAAKNL